MHSTVCHSSSHSPTLSRSLETRTRRTTCGRRGDCMPLGRGGEGLRQGGTRIRTLRANLSLPVSIASPSERASSLTTLRITRRCSSQSAVIGEIEVGGDRSAPQTLLHAIFHRETLQSEVRYCSLHRTVGRMLLVLLRGQNSVCLASGNWWWWPLRSDPFRAVAELQRPSPHEATTQAALRPDTELYRRHIHTPSYTLAAR